MLEFEVCYAIILLYETKTVPPTACRFWMAAVRAEKACIRLLAAIWRVASSLLLVARVPFGSTDI